MSHKIIFSKEQSEQLAMDIISFCKKWGMWQDVQIFTGGKCYTDSKEAANYNGISGVKIRVEANPDERTKGLTQDCDGEWDYKCFSNPEHLLDMTFDGPLCLLLSYGEYEVSTENLSAEAKEYIALNDEEVEDEVIDKALDYLDNGQGWDPIEFDSYEEYLELVEYCEPYYDKRVFNDLPKDFSSKEEYKEFLEKAQKSK